MNHMITKAFAATLFAAGLACAQTGIAGGSMGLHQVGTQTLGQWNISFGTGGDVALDNWSVAKGGIVYDAQGNDMGLYDIDGSFTGNFNVAVGLLNWLDIGANLPVYYDYTGSKSGEDETYNMTTISRGDVETWVKARVYGGDSTLFSAGVMVQAYWPTGETGAGIRPRHVWYVRNHGKVTNPYTADAIALAASGLFTFDFRKKGAPLIWNTQLGFLYIFEDDAPKEFIYSTGLNWLVHPIVDLFLEFSGEMRVMDDIWGIDGFEDPMILTPGARFHVTKNVDFGIGLEIAARVVKNITYDYKDEIKSIEYMVNYEAAHGEKARYGYASTPLIAGAATLVYRFGAMDEQNERRLNDSLSQAKVDSILAARAARNDSLSKVDSDKDGIVDINDRCPNTMDSISVDSTGCPLDADKDGVPDSKDKCPTTAAGTSVGPDGCEPDFDKDGIFDAFDKCPNTQAGLAVDSTGCPVDTDKDGVNDASDKCPNTPAGVTVDASGCPLDFDHDGVVDISDKCPNTRANVVVDSVGCDLDGDKDGVADGLDKCPNTPAGITVDSVGCSLDFDKDGVTDMLDKCPNTLPGVKIDDKGCPLNKKQDLDALKKGIKFKLNSAKLTKDSYGTLDDIVKLMKEIPEANLEVQGHTDELGSEETNKKLSQDRAQAVVDYFVSKGVAAERLRAVGYGATKPLADNKSKEGRKANRRVELVPFSKN